MGGGLGVVEWHTATHEEGRHHVMQKIEATTYTATAQSPEQVAARFAMPLAWARAHQGEHICVDGRTYINSCLVTDPTCEQIARNRMGIGR